MSLTAKPFSSDRVSEKAKELIGRRKWAAVALGAAFALLLVYLLALKPMAQFLLVRSDLQRSDIIVVLGGGWSLERTTHAVSLYERGYADKILVVGSKLRINGDYWVVKGESVSEPLLAGLFANHLGVRKESLLLDDRSHSTYHDAIYAREDLLKMGAKSATIVSSPYHMRRAYYVFRKAFKGTNILLFFSPAEEAWFKIDWKWSWGELNAMRHEYMAMAYYLLKGYI